MALSTSRDVIIFGVGLLTLGAVILALTDRSSPTPKVSDLVSSSPMHGAAGIAVADDGTLYVVSFNGQSIYHIDPKNGHVDVAVGPPFGKGDDIALGPAGTRSAGILAWTTLESVNVLRPGGKPEVLMEPAPRANPIAFDRDGRLFFSQSGTPENELWELDPFGVTPPHLVLRGQGPLNGFGFGPDGRLYSPLFGTDQAIAIDVGSGAIAPIANGLGSVVAVKPDSKGNLFSIDYKTGDVWRITAKTGNVKRLTTLSPPLDNLAVAADGTLYVSGTAESTIFAVDSDTGATRKVAGGPFNTPLGMVMTTHAGKPALLAAQPMGFIYIDPATGDTVRPSWDDGRNGSFAIAADARSVITVFNRRLRKIDRNSDTVVRESRDEIAPSGVVLAPSGEIIVTEITRGAVLKWTDEGFVAIAEGLAEPTAIALDSPTSILVTETNAGQISRIDLLSGQRTVVASGLDRPQGVVKLHDGQIAFAESGRGVVAVISPDGHRHELASGLSLSTAGLRVPSTVPIGMAVDSDGTLYVACAGDNRIVKIAIAK